MPPSNETFYVLDLDRCLANTDKLFALFEYVVLQEKAIGKEVLLATLGKIEKDGGPFDVAVHLRDYLASSGEQDMLLLIKDEFIKASRDDDFFEPGAHDLLQFLADNSLPFGILTYGGRVWQHMKLQAMDLDATPHIITDIQAKGQIIAGWKQADGMFLIPSEFHKNGSSATYKNILLVDDKLISFEGLPKGAHGVHVVTNHTLPFQGDVPAHVTQAHGMTEVGALIKASISV